MPLTAGGVPVYRDSAGNLHEIPNGPTNAVRWLLNTFNEALKKNPYQAPVMGTPPTLAVSASTDAAREDHIHPLPSGVLTQVATATIGETTLISLSLGVKRYTVSAAGTTTSDRIVAALTGAPTNCTIQDAYVSVAGTISVGALVPAVGIGATVACPLALYKVN